MNVTGTQTTQATTAPASEMNTHMAQSPQRRCWFPKPGYQPYPPFIQPPSFGAHQIIGVVQQMLEMLMRMLQQMIGGRPRLLPAPMPRPLPPAQIGLPQLPSIDFSKPDSLIGRNIRDLPSLGRSGNVRVLTPGTYGTADYNPNRLTINVDHSGTITSAGWN